MFELREELLHPLSAHFPVALFVLATFVKLAEIIFQKNESTARNCSVIFNFLIMLTPLFYLITMFLGDLSLEIIKPKFCDLASAGRHEDLAYETLYFLVGALLFFGIASIEQVRKRFYLQCQIVVLIFLVLGNFYLIQTAHLGATLVYEKGAAVKGYTGKCR